ncbi:MAG TPA: ATP-binding protein [Thermoanaerobaculia bacterium]|nr:ATP-binding protein [Thermoanaerobaculia bacterium]
MIGEELDGPRRRSAAAGEGVVYPVRAPEDVAIARNQAQRLARELGFGRKRAAEIAIVVSELASNIVKYGVRGEIALALAAAEESRDGPGKGRGELMVVARDAGPPIHDLATAMRDGCDDRGPIDPAILLRRGGLGTGLGAVVRLADHFEYRHAEACAAGKEIRVGFYR